MDNQVYQDCPAWDCEDGFRQRLRPSKDGVGFSWQYGVCPICNGTGKLPVR